MTEMITVTQSRFGDAEAQVARRRCSTRVEVRKLTLSSAIDGTDLTSRKVATRTTSTMTNADAPERQPRRRPGRRCGLLPPLGAHAARHRSTGTGAAGGAQAARSAARSTRPRSSASGIGSAVGAAVAGAVDRLAADPRGGNGPSAGAARVADRSSSLALPWCVPVVRRCAPPVTALGGDRRGRSTGWRQLIFAIEALHLGRERVRQRGVTQLGELRPGRRWPCRSGSS